MFLEKAPRFADNCDAFFKYDAGTIIGEKIEIALPVARLNILQAMPLFWKRPQSLRHKTERACLQRGFAALGEETCALGANEITDIEQTKKIDQVRANFFCVNVNLNAPGGITKIEEVALAHVAMRGDAASRAQDLALCEFFASQRDQFILFIHPWHSLPVC